jgi:SNF2-related domain/SNF2 Helicase protein/Helicase conserved C-terminal domain
MSANLLPGLSPHGRLRLVHSDQGSALDLALAERLTTSFEQGAGLGLLHLGAVEVGVAMPPAFAWWRGLAARYVTALCTRADEPGGHRAVPPPSVDALDALLVTAPPMPGGEYLSVAVLQALWAELDRAFGASLRRSGVSTAELLQTWNAAWNVVGRVHFNLAENRRDPEAPFAFLATWTPRLSAHGRAAHQPLGQALREHAGPGDREALLSLLLPVQRASAACPWLAALVEGGELFHPLRWTPSEAFRLLNSSELLERAGVIVRMPATWRGGQPARVRATGTVGQRAPSALGASALLDFQAHLTVDDAPLTALEVAEILSQGHGLAMIRGQWVEVDPERLRRTMDRYAQVEALAASEGLQFSQAMRLLAGADIGEAGASELADRSWSGVVAGPWLAEVLRALRSPDRMAQLDPGDALRGSLRPYQEVGVRWLHLLSSLGLGACLADDMGMGKTIQVLALLLLRKREAAAPRRPSLLVAPASLLANWAAEAERFAPSLRLRLAHPTAMSTADLRSLDAERLDNVDLVITSYGTLLRHSGLQATEWDLAVLDEAQAIKNADTKQSRVARKLHARARIALTGTPIENRVGDLWSIFDFTNPGLLGSGRQFTTYTKRLGARGADAWGPLRDLVRPYILRRLKTDRSVIADLPDKTEVNAWCGLSRPQAALYQQAVTDLRERLQSAEGMARRGLVLASLMRFKQICNHPSQWLGDGNWAEADSGKWGRLRELCEVIASRQEKVLVFTQFREVTAPLAAFLGEVFGRSGLVLHGQTPVGQRQGLVRRFQDDEDLPFFVLSLKAGGSGLNLTAASHVIHFDRWWNPAVENQATDRAYRIGQSKNVLVHKFVCRGTVEDHIDQLIASKRALSQDLLEGGAELDLSAMADDDLMRLVSLDLQTAMQE